MMIYRQFAKVLDYPTPETCTEIGNLAGRISGESPEAGALLREFYTACASMTTGEFEELYTSTFDMRPDCTPNLGHHLFGDDVRRNLFMAQLKERMAQRQIAAGTELPDHLSLVLELLAVQDSAEEAQTLMADCLLPALSRMLQSFDQGGPDNPYAKALHALWLLLKIDSGDETATVTSAQDKSGAA